MISDIEILFIKEDFIKFLAKTGNREAWLCLQQDSVLLNFMGMGV